MLGRNQLPPSSQRTLTNFQGFSVAVSPRVSPIVHDLCLLGTRICFGWRECRLHRGLYFAFEAVFLGSSPNWLRSMRTPSRCMDPCSCVGVTPKCSWQLLNNDLRDSDSSVLSSSAGTVFIGRLAHQWSMSMAASWRASRLATVALESSQCPQWTALPGAVAH